MNLKITSLVHMKLRIDRRFRRDADTDYVGSIIPLNFGEKYPIEVQPVPFRNPNAVRVNLMTFRHCYLEYRKG